jgi:diaminopropionate ammonia-lyase
VNGILKTGAMRERDGIERQDTTRLGLPCLNLLGHPLKLIRNEQPQHNASLDAVDADTLSIAAARQVEDFLKHRANYKPTPLHRLSGLAAALGVGEILMKDEGLRLGLGSFKALGGSYAVTRLVLEAASRRIGRPVGIEELHSAHVHETASQLTVACATDGNHGRSVAQGAQLVGTRAVIFVHSGVSDERIAAIAHYGAEIIRVDGNYDDSVAEASRVCGEHGWIVVSDTSWPGYERIPGLIMQGYTAIISEALRQMPDPPTHLFIQAGVGGIAAALAGHFSIVLGKNRPTVVVVEPDRAACVYESARAGRPVRIEQREPTVMAMLECYEPSIVAWRILSRVADVFMTIDESDAIDVMGRLAHPAFGDPPIVAGESGGVGLAGLIRVARDKDMSAKIGLNSRSRIFVVNTEGATDRELYVRLTGLAPEHIGVVVQNGKPLN